jgi:hypothetical protein
MKVDVTLVMSDTDEATQADRPRTVDAERERLLSKLRAQRDQAAASGDHADALILNERIQDLKSGSVTVEQVMQRFESALARKAFFGPRRVQ